MQLVTDPLEYNNLISNSKSNLSQSNRFRITFKNLKFYFSYNFTITTKKLGVFGLSKNRYERLELILKMSDLGCSNRDIADYLNSNNLKSIRTKSKYTPKLIWAILKKYRLRLNRYNRDQISEVIEKLHILY